IVSISFGIALVAGRKRVPRPATGKTALRMAFMEPVGDSEPWRVYTRCVKRQETLIGALSGSNDRPLFPARPPPCVARPTVCRGRGPRAGRPLSAIAPGYHRVRCAAVRQVERRAGRVGPSADDAGRRSGGGRGFQELPR